MTPIQQVRHLLDTSNNDQVVEQLLANQALVEIFHQVIRESEKELDVPSRTRIFTILQSIDPHLSEVQKICDAISGDTKLSPKEKAELKTCKHWNEFSDVEQKLIAYACIQHEDWKTLQLILDKDKFLLQKPLGKTLFYLICDMPGNHESLIKKCLALGADLNAQGEGGLTPFHRICENYPSSASLIRECLKKQGDLHLPSEEGTTPFHLICKNTKSSDLIRECLYKGANLNHQEKNGSTPFYWICKNYEHEPDLIRECLKSGGDFNVPNKYGITPFLWICINHGYFRPNFIKECLKKEVNLNVQNKDGVTLLEQLIFITFKENPELILECLKKEVNLNVQNKDGVTLLERICITYKNHPDLIRECLKKEVNLNVPNKDGITPFELICISYNNSPSLILECLQRGGDLNLQNVFSYQTPFYWICKNYKNKNDFFLIRECLRRGGNLNIPDNKGIRPIHYLYNHFHDQPELLRECREAIILDFDSGGGVVLPVEVLKILFPKWNWKKILENPLEKIALMANSPQSIVASFANPGAKDVNLLEICLVFANSNLYGAISRSFPNKMAGWKAEIEKEYPAKCKYLGIKSAFLTPKSVDVELPDISNFSLDEALKLYQKWFSWLNFTDPNEDFYVPPERIFDQEVTSRRSPSKLKQAWENFCLVLKDPSKSQFDVEVRATDITGQVQKNFRYAMFGMRTKIEEIKKEKDPVKRAKIQREIADHLMRIAMTGNHCFNAKNDACWEAAVYGNAAAKIEIPTFEEALALFLEFRRKIKIESSFTSQDGKTVQFHRLERFYSMFGKELGIRLDGHLPRDLFSLKEGLMDIFTQVIQRFGPQVVAAEIMKEMKNERSEIPLKMFKIWLSQHVPPEWDYWDELSSEISSMSPKDAYEFLRGRGVDPTEREIMEIVSPGAKADLLEIEKEADREYREKAAQLDKQIQSQRIKQQRLIEEADLKDAELEMRYLEDSKGKTDEEKALLQTRLQSEKMKLYPDPRETQKLIEEYKALTHEKAKVKEQRKSEYLEMHGISLDRDKMNPKEYLLYRKKMESPEFLEKELLGLPLEEQNEILAVRGIDFSTETSRKPYSEEGIRTIAQSLVKEIEEKPLDEQRRILESHGLEFPESGSYTFEEINKILQQELLDQPLELQIEMLNRRKIVPVEKKSFEPYSSDEIVEICKIHRGLQFAVDAEKPERLIYLMTTLGHFVLA